MSEPTFRAVEEADIPEVRRIAAAAWTPIYGHWRELMGEDLFARQYPGDRLKNKADQVESHFRSHPEWIFVVEFEGKVVGFCTYVLRDSGVGEIGNNAIDPEYQGRGLGSAMHRECLRRMREAGMKYAQVRTGLDGSHAPARRAYEAVGFKATLPHIEYFMEF